MIRIRLTLDIRRRREPEPEQPAPGEGGPGSAQVEHSGPQEFAWPATPAGFGLPDHWEDHRKPNDRSTLETR